MAVKWHYIKTFHSRKAAQDYAEKHWKRGTAGIFRTPKGRYSVYVKTGR